MCEDYEILLAAINAMTPCEATDYRYRNLTRLRDELEQEIILSLTHIK